MTGARASHLSIPRFARPAALARRNGLARNAITTIPLWVRTPNGRFPNDFSGNHPRFARRDFLAPKPARPKTALPNNGRAAGSGVAPITRGLPAIHARLDALSISSSAICSCRAISTSTAGATRHRGQVRSRFSPGGRRIRTLGPPVRAQQFRRGPFAPGNGCRNSRPLLLKRASGMLLSGRRPCVDGRIAAALTLRRGQHIPALITVF